MATKNMTFREWLNGKLNDHGQRLTLSVFSIKTKIPYPTCSTYSRGLLPGPINAEKIRRVYSDCPIAAKA